MLDQQNRRLLMDAMGSAVDGLVRELYSDRPGGRSIAQEPEITSRLCQRLEDRLDGESVGGYRLRVAARSMPDRGPKSLEKVTGADLLLSVSLEGPDGFDKALFIQAKYDRNVSRTELLDACQRMERHIGAKGAYVWIYESNGVKVISPSQVRRMQGNSFAGLHRRSMAGLTGRILDCYAGSRASGIPPGLGRQHIIEQRLREFGIPIALDIDLKPLS